MTCPGDPAEWGGCSLDIFYADQVTRTGPITRVHRSCYPASGAVGTADGSCLPDQMGAGSVWCYCAADGCNYYSSTQTAGVDAKGQAVYKPAPGAAGGAAAPGVAPVVGGTQSGGTNPGGSGTGGNGNGTATDPKGSGSDLGSNIGQLDQVEAAVRGGSVNASDAGTGGAKNATNSHDGRIDGSLYAFIFACIYVHASFS
ncbi:hypothetical protein RvY_06485 [Ramazzottius varieornatus]|uniref:Uncharacterized protein n=1 Tax=Ramazzottius varieornatus TaxID=947166 RepID=A0A1D1UYT4_RAMVA|nr:hypothetical protein RvY_06485 [Ramazzottius varieornatus]